LGRQLSAGDVCPRIFNKLSASVQSVQDEKNVSLGKCKYIKILVICAEDPMAPAEDVEAGSPYTPPVLAALFLPRH
jgi:hypothetical protein